MDYYYDDYEVADAVDYEEERYTDIFEEPSRYEHLASCIQPSVQQISGYIAVLVAVNIAFRILLYGAKYARIGIALHHVLSLLSGCGLLYFAAEYECLIVLFLSIIAYVVILIADYCRFKRLGLIITVAAISSHFIYEILWNQPEMWQRIRGIQMVATMKIISLAFDYEDNNNSSHSSNTDIGGRRAKSAGNLKTMPGLVPYLGYIFCPATCLLGPWISYSSYLRSLQKMHQGYRWIVWTLFNIIFSIAFLCMSNCIVPLLCADSAWKWAVTYRDALTVRCSHYFISFMSQATLAAAGVELRAAEEPSTMFGHLVTKPWHIEFPRSLSALVRSWNIPMHDWLKTYIFRALRNRTDSYALALFCTYIVSSLLHGAHVKIYLVLLSLSIFAYAERLIRKKLASVFNACISANACKSNCSYALCPTSLAAWGTASAVRLVNVLFSALAIVNLAYLGIILSNPHSAAESTGFSELASDLQKWANLDYVCHWLAVIIFIVNYLI